MKLQTVSLAAALSGFPGGPLHQDRGSRTGALCFDHLLCLCLHRLPGAQEGAAHAGGADRVPRCSEEERKPLELMKTLLAPTIVPTPLEERLRGRSFKAE